MLKEVLNNVEFEGLTDAESVSKLNETVELNRDDSSYLWGGLNLKLLDKGVNETTVETWDQAIVNLPGGTMLDKMLSSGGVNLSLESVRVPIQAAIGTSTAEIDSLLNALLEIGIETGKRYEFHGLESLPTETEVAEARATIQNERDVASLMNDVINPAIADGATVAEIKTAVADWSV